MDAQGRSGVAEETGAPDPAVLAAHQRIVEAGVVVFDEGDAGRALYFIRSGEVELTRRGSAGARRVARLGPGEFFGEQGVLLAGPHRGRAIVTRDAELIELDAGAFSEMCSERSDILLRITRTLAARAQALEHRLASLEGEDSVRSLVRVLIRLAHPSGDTTCVDGTLRVLAGEAGLGLLEAHHAIQNLVERKLVRLVEDVLILPDLDGLTASLETSA